MAHTMAEKLIPAIKGADGERLALAECVSRANFDAGYGRGESYRLADGSSVQWDGRGWRAVLTCGHARGQCIGCETGAAR